MGDEIMGYINGIPIYSKDWSKYPPKIDAHEIYKMLKKSDKKSKVNI